MSVVCLANPRDTSFAHKQAQESFGFLLDKTGLQGQVLLPEGDLSRASVEKVFRHLVATQYKTYVGTLHLGDEMRSAITLCPPPTPYRAVKDFEIVEASVSENIDIKGFMTLPEVSSPPVISRHLVLPWAKPESDPIEGEGSKTKPNLCVYLHGGLKQENHCALVQVQYCTHSPKEFLKFEM